MAGSVEDPGRETSHTAHTRTWQPLLNLYGIFSNIYFGLDGLGVISWGIIPILPRLPAISLSGLSDLSGLSRLSRLFS